MSERWTVYGLWAVLGLCVSPLASAQGEADSSWVEVKRLAPPPSPLLYYQYGTAMASDGDRLVVGSRSYGIGQTNYGTVLIYRQEGLEWVLEQKLLAPDLDPSSSLGESVAIQGDYLFAGASVADHSDHPDFQDTGAVYVFKNSHTPLGWVFEQKLEASNLSRSDQFGSSISLDGNRVAIGAENRFERDLSHLGRGGVYLFELQGDEWVETGWMYPPSEEEGYDAKYGEAVILKDSLLVVGAPRASIGEPFAYQGAVYIYGLHSSGGWMLDTTLFSNMPEDDAKFFGTSLAFQEGKLIVGATTEKASRTDAVGAVYIYDKQYSVWELEQKLLSPEQTFGVLFGLKVSISGDRILVGTQTGDRAHNWRPGKSYLYHATDSGWVLELEMTATDGYPNDGFGKGVHLFDENTAIVAQPFFFEGEDIVEDGEFGRLYFYRFQGPNAAPTVDVELSEILTDDLAPPHLIDLDTVFSDADGDALLYSASVLAESGTTDWRIDDSLLTVSFLQPGVEFITLEADDCKGGQAQTDLRVTVTQAPNFPPELAVAIPDRVTQERANDIPYDLSVIFRDPNRRDSLTYSVTQNTDPAAISTRIEDETLWLEVGQIGQTTLTVRCTDPAGEFAEGSFTVTVERGPNRAPFVAFPFPDLTADRLGGERSIHLYTIFSDPDGDELSFSVVSETNPGVVSHRFEGEFLVLTYESIGETELLVSATDPEGRSAADDLRVVVPVVASVPLSDGALPAVYPNPAASTVELNLDLSEGPVQAQVYDVNGRLRLEKTLRSERERTLDVSALPAGVYVLKARQGQRLSTWKLLKR